MFIFEIANTAAAAIDTLEFEFPVYSRHGVALFKENLGIQDIDGVDLI